MKRSLLLANYVVALFIVVAPLRAADDAPTVEVGLARHDVTPAYPVRLTGYANRKTEAEGTEQRLWAKAMAIGSDAQGPVVIITVDNLGIPAKMTEEVSSRLQKKANLPLARLAICASHTHCAPALNAIADLILNEMKPEEREHINQYSRELTDAFEQVALAALADRSPARLEYGEGRVGFANNRRTVVDGVWKGFGTNPDALVDHSMPVLIVSQPDGKLRSVLVNYACHCTTLGGDFNKYCGDWAGYAQEIIERENPGLVAMIAIGCGADMNPFPRGQLPMAVEHGQNVANEVKRLLGEKRTALGAVTEANSRAIALPFDTLPTRAEYAERAKQKGPIAKHAQAQIDRLDRGEKLPTTLPYRVQTWHFGTDLAMVFLPGEVTVDYALRLKRECTGRRLWVAAYANDEPCYIPSRRLIPQSGYEVESSMYYYDRPTHFALEVEDRIIAAVEALLPESYREALTAPAKKWNNEIAATLAKTADQKSIAGIVFLGSSSIKRWNVHEAFSGLPVINHGFGGSQYADALYFVDRLVVDYKPKTVVVYEGDNDLNSGKSPEQVASDGIATVMAIRRGLPEARILWLSIKPSPKRWKLIDTQRKANAIMANYAQTSGDKRLQFVDVGSCLLNGSGPPPDEYFVADGLHLSDAGYARWNELLRPLLTEGPQ